jgi:Mg-chelatase subunit ChlD
VSPRYVPASKQDFEGLTDADQVNPPVSTEGTPYGLDLRVEADLLSPVRGVESPSHKIRTDIDGSRATVSLAGAERQLDSDFVLLLRGEEAVRSSAILGRDADGQRFVMAIFVPEVEAARKPIDVVFLVDCSGSMRGDSIADAKRLLRLALSRLGSEDRFDVVRFGSRHESLFGHPVPVAPKSIRTAKKFAKRLDADLGGTEIGAPLVEILESAADGDRPTAILLLTDGQVTNESELIEMAAKHRDHATILATGLGAGVSEHLVRGLARATGGAAELAHPGEDLEDKMRRQFQRLGLVTGGPLRVEWEGLEVEEVTPEVVTLPCPGEPVAVLGRVTAGTAGKAILRGGEGDESWSLEANLEERPPDAVADELVPLVWARGRVRDLEAPAADGKERLVELAMRYGLMSSATSYVVVQEREDAETAERAELRRIPVSLTKGWGGLARRSGGPTHFLYRQAPIGRSFTGEARLTIALDRTLADTLADQRRALRKTPRPIGPADGIPAVTFLRNLVARHGNRFRDAGCPLHLDLGARSQLARLDRAIVDDLREAILEILETILEAGPRDGGIRLGLGAGEQGVTIRLRATVDREIPEARKAELEGRVHALGATLWLRGDRETGRVFAELTLGPGDDEP